MAFSHHSHSGQFCLHASGTLKEMVQSAIAQSFGSYSLTEHMPRSRHKDLYPEEVAGSITPSKLTSRFEAFLSEAEKLRAAHSSEVEILIGMETEWIDHSSPSSSAADLNKVLDAYAGKLDFLVGSVHHVLGIPIDFDRETFDRALAHCSNLPPPRSLGFPPGPPEGGVGEMEKLCCAYFDAQYDLLQETQPAVVGHFDLCRLYDPAFPFDKHLNVWSRVQRNVDFAIGYGALFEVNSSALRKGWKTAYPGPEVLELIISHGGRLTLSDDSHSPKNVGLHYPSALRYLRSQGVTELWYLKRIDSASAGFALEHPERVTVVPGVHGHNSRVHAHKVSGDWWEEEFVQSLL